MEASTDMAVLGGHPMYFSDEFDEFVAMERGCGLASGWPLAGEGRDADEASTFGRARGARTGNTRTRHNETVPQ